MEPVSGEIGHYEATFATAEGLIHLTSAQGEMEGNFRPIKKVVMQKYGNVPLGGCSVSWFMF